MDTQLIVLIVVAVLVVLTGAILLVRRSRPELAAPPRDRLGTTRRTVGERLSAVFGRDRIDERFWSELEEELLAADVGPRVVSEVVEEVRSRRPSSPAEARDELRDGLARRMVATHRDLDLKGDPAVIVMVGVNGVGKTTSIAKLAARLEDQGHPTILGCADTYRAAADLQLREWGERVGVPVISGQASADPASVAFDAYQAARGRNKEVVIIDTAGRLHSEHNLMEELGKIVRVLDREAGRLDEVLLVLDATIGQNAIAQARRFTEAVGVTGIVLTKMDGTARGGVVVAIEDELGIPVKLIGIGERLEDLAPFEPRLFLSALLGEAA